VFRITVLYIDVYPKSIFPGMNDSQVS